MPQIVQKPPSEHANVAFEVKLKSSWAIILIVFRLSFIFQIITTIILMIRSQIIARRRYIIIISDRLELEIINC